MGQNEVEFSIRGKDKYSKQFSKLHKTIDKTAKVAAGFGVAFAVSAGVAGKAIIDVGDKTENLKLRMSTMLGSVAEGNKVFSDMTKFASEVPFAYEDIMSSATQLSGILKGGSEEIAQTMPMIADLAAVSGLSIEKTTEQVSRMFSAGAGAADLFRERGINAMLGFKAGVAVTAEETKARLIDAFEDPMSKFRGASAKLATTWSGIMSMIGDKWFAIKSQIADAGVFNYFKAIATVINDLMGQALDNTRENAVTWSNVIIDGIRSVMNAVGIMADMWQGLKAVWIGLKLAFAKAVEFILQGMVSLSDSVKDLLSNIPWVTIKEGVSGLTGILNQAKLRSAELGEELDNIVNQPMPSEAVENFAVQVEETFIKLNELSLAQNTAISDAAEIARMEAEQSAEPMADRKTSGREKG